MPSHICKHPTCSRIGPKAGWCAEHAHHAPRPSREQLRQRDRYYDQHVRDPEAKEFYNSRSWKDARRKRLTDHPVCEHCGREWSRHVHHVIPLSKCTLAQKTDQDNLRAVCIPCHNVLEADSIYRESS